MNNLLSAYVTMLLILLSISGGAIASETAMIHLECIKNSSVYPK